MFKAQGLVVIGKKIFSYFPYKSLCKTYDPWAAHFLPQGHNLNKLGKGSRDDASYKKIKALGLVVSEKKNFSCFPYVSL